MSKTSVSQWDTTAANNTDVGGINIQGTAPVSNFDNAVREMMAQIATGIASGSFTGAGTVAKSANYTVLTTDRGYLIDCTATLTLSLPAAATAASGFSFIAKANGATVTIDPSGAELVDGAATIAIPPGQAGLIVCTGTAWKSAYISGAHPSSSTDNAVARYDGTTGGLQNSGVIVDDSNNVTVADVTSTGTLTSGQVFKASGTSVILAATGVGAVRLRPNGFASSVGEVSLSAAGAVTINGTLTVTG